MMNRTHLSTIMRQAWQLARSVAELNGGSARDFFRTCLKISWAGFRVADRVAPAPIEAAPVPVEQPTVTVTEAAPTETIVDAPATPFRAPVVNSCVRGGGCGARAWIARIVGTHARFVFEREFVERHDNLSGSGRSGSMWWRLPEPGYYEYRGLQYDKEGARIGQLDNCYVEVGQDGVIYEATRAEVLAAMRKLEAAA